MTARPCASGSSAYLRRMDIAALDLAAPRRLVVLTGSGISAESGLPTFRGGNGLWDGRKVDDVATADGFAIDPKGVWAFYSDLRAKAAAAEPNAAHRALVAIEERLGDRFLLVTQNVDGLHQRAGSQRVIEIHGSLWRSRCSRSWCRRGPFADRTFPIGPPVPLCERCGSHDPTAYVRPDIVWFGEPLDESAIWQARLAMLAGKDDGLVFLAIGTSGAVWPTNTFVRFAADQGADTISVNLDAPENARSFKSVIIGRATEVLPALLGT